MKSLLKFYQENPKLIDTAKQDEDLENCFYDQELSYDELLIKVDKWIDKKKKENLFDGRKNLEPEFPKEFILSHITLLKALVAQRESKRNCFRKRNISYEKTPLRFQDKFEELLESGFVHLGPVIRDSLSEDPNVNCGNPFGFLPGDLGYWWAGLVIEDWFVSTMVYSTISKNHVSCADFYELPDGSKFNQLWASRDFSLRSGKVPNIEEFSHQCDGKAGASNSRKPFFQSSRIVDQFLTDHKVKNNFFATINNVEFDYEVANWLMASNRTLLDGNNPESLLKEKKTNFEITGQFNNTLAVGNVTVNDNLSEGNRFAALLEKLKTNNKLPETKNLEKAIQKFKEEMLDLTTKMKDVGLETIKQREAYKTLLQNTAAEDYKQKQNFKAKMEKVVAEAHRQNEALQKTIRAWEKKKNVLF